jgi:DNA polymerase-3 subunit gamma/tau
MADFVSAINLYANIIKESNPNLYFIIGKAIYNDLTKYNVEILVNNSIDEKELLNKRTEITQFLSKRLNYKELRLNIKVKKENRKEIIYNPVDKYQYLLAKNPLLNKLRKEFNADLNY